MAVFGKSTGQLDVLLADFLPFADQLYIVVADVDCNLHIMQYDPERESELNPGSSASLVFRMVSRMLTILIQIQDLSPEHTCFISAPFTLDIFQPL